MPATRIRVALATLFSAAIIGALGVASTTSAQAGPQGTCDRGWACLYNFPHYNERFHEQPEYDLWRSFRNDQGDFSNYTWRDGSGYIRDINGSVNNSTASIKNRSGTGVCLYRDKNFEGPHAWLAPGTWKQDLWNSWVGSDMASSIKFRYYRSDC